MAYDKKQYVRVNWKNKPSTATPLDEVNLNNMDNFLNVVDNTLIQFEAQKLNIATANSMIASLTIDTDSGIITAKQLDGTTFTWDLNIEKIPVSFSLSEDGILTMITEDGTEWTCDIAELIKEYVFDDSETIAFTREISEEDGSIHIGAAVKEGSIKSEHLHPDYRADIQEYKNQAEQAANESLSYSKDAKRWAVGDEEYEGSDTDNSKYYKEQAEAAKVAAEQARDEAQAATGAVIATTETVGVVKPDGESIEIAEDGTIKSPLAQTDKAGIIKPDNVTIGVENDGTLKMIAKAANLPITDMQGLVGEENQETTTQLLINAIAEKVANQLVTNDALTTQLANYVTKAMMSNVQVNDQNKVPTSALAYAMNEDISELNSNLNTRFYFSGAGNTALQTVLNDDNIRYRLQINPDGAARVYESSVGGGNPWTGDTLITNSALLSRHVRQISVTNYENIYLKTTETAISIIKPEELASVGVVGLEFGGGDNCYWVFTSLVSGSNVTTGRKYARNFYIGTYKITLALSEDLSTLYAKSTATANVDDCRFRRLFVLTYT